MSTLETSPAVVPDGGVLHIITGLHTGGAEGQLATLARARHDAGLPVRVVSLLPGGAHTEGLRAAGLDVDDLRMTRGRASLAALVRLVTIIRAWRPAVIQSWLYHADLYAAAALKLSGRRPETRLFWGVRCSDMDAAHYPIRLRLARRLCALASRTPDGIVANAETGIAAHRLLGYRPDNFQVIENGIDTARFAPDPAARQSVREALGIRPEAFVIAHTARVDPMKDHATLLAALARADGVEALLIGAGTERLEAPPRVHRLGRRDDVPRLLAACDAVVSSSAFGEGFSNAIAEGMACALPAVVTRCGDSERIVGDCGFLVPPGDPAALAAGIETLRGLDPGALGRRARKRIEQNFSVARMVRAYDLLHFG